MSTTPARNYSNNNIGAATNLRAGSSRPHHPSTSFRSPSPAGNFQFSPNPRMPSQDREDSVENNNNDNHNTRRNNNNSPNLLDEIGDKISTVQRSVSRGWTTFLAEHFPSALEDSTNVVVNNTNNNNNNNNGLPPLANQTRSTHNNNNNQSTTSPISPSQQSPQRKLNYRKLLKARLGLLKKNNNKNRSSSLSQQRDTMSATRPLAFEEDDNNDEENQQQESTTTSSLSTLFRWTQRLQNRQAGAFDDPSASKTNSSSDDEDDDDDNNDFKFPIPGLHDSDDDDDADNGDFFDHSFALGKSASTAMVMMGRSPSRASAAAAQKTVEDLKTNTVDKRYWDPNFDAIKAELESFPSGLQEKDLPRELRMLDLLSKDRASQGRAVDSVLKQRLLENYPVFNHGMEHIQDVSKDLVSTATDCKRARQDLDHLKKTFILNGLRIPRLAQRKDRVAEVLDVLEAVELMQLRDREMNQLIKECRFRDALDLAESGDLIFSGELGELLKGVKVADKLNENWKEMTSNLGKLADSAWDQCFNRGTFDQEKYEGVFETHALIGKGDSKRVAQVLGKNIREAVQMGLVAASSAKNMNDLRQLVAGLEPDLIVVTVCQMAARLADHIAIYLTVMKFHEEMAKVTTTTREVPPAPSTSEGDAAPSSFSPPSSSSSPRGLPPLNNNGGTTRPPSLSPSNTNNNNTTRRGGHSRTSSSSAFLSAVINTPRRSVGRSESSCPSSMTRRATSLSRGFGHHHHHHHSVPRKEESTPRNGNNDDFDYGNKNYYDRNHDETSPTNNGEVHNKNGSSSPDHNQQQQQQQDQEKKLRDLHLATWKELEKELSSIGFVVQRELKNVAEVFALDSEHFKLLPIDSALHVFYILAMAVECTTHMNVDSFATRATRDTLRLFAKELVKNEVYHKGCRSIIESLVKETWTPLPEDSSDIRKELQIVTGITPKDYQEDRKAVKQFITSGSTTPSNFLTTSTTTFENNPFLLPHMVDQRKDALETLDTVKARINPYRNTVMRSVLRAAQLYFEITCRVVVRFPPLAVEVAEWNCDAYSMFLYVVASTMIGVSKTEKLQDHYDFHPKARGILTELEKWASNLYELSFQGQSMMVSVRNGGASVPSNNISMNSVTSGDYSSNNNRAVSSEPSNSASSLSPGRAAFHFEQMPVQNNQFLMQNSSHPHRTVGVNQQDMPTMTMAQLRALQQQNTSSTSTSNPNSTSNLHNNNINNSASTTTAPSTRAASVSSSSNPNSDSRFVSTTTTTNASGNTNNNSDSITHNNINYQHSFVGRGEIQIRLSQEFPPPVYAGIHQTYESPDALFAASERLNAIESCYALLDVLKQSVASVKEVVSSHTMKNAAERIESLSYASDAIVHVGCHRMCHALFPVSLLVDEIADSRWDTHNVTLVSNLTVSTSVATSSSSSSQQQQQQPYNRGYQLSPEFRYGDWTKLLQDRCRRFFVNSAPRLKFASAHLKTAYWRHFVFNIQRAIVTGFAKSSRASETVVAAMKAETEFIMNYLKKLFPNNNGSGAVGSVFIREYHVLSFLDAYSYDLPGRIRWIRDNHEYYNSEDLTMWFMNLHSASIERHHMKQLLSELKHSDCVPIELFVETERKEERW